MNEIVTNDDVPAPRAKRRGRGRETAGISRPVIGRNPKYLDMKNTLPKADVFSRDEVAEIHRTSLKVLSELGIRVLLKAGRDIYKKAGARVDEDTQMVFFDPGMIEELVALAPKQFTMKAQSREYDFTCGGNSILFGAGAGCPNITDLDRGKRAGTLADFIETTKLQQSFDVIGKLAPSIEAQDIPLEIRHLEMTRVQLELAGKTPFIWARGTGQVEDGFRMVALAQGMSDDEFAREPRTFCVINTNSPRQLDNPMTQGLIDFARWGQPCVVTPFCLAGAMAPISTAGALTLSHAEAMAGIALTQIVNPGCPVVYGAFSSNVDMKSGSPAFGTPEHMKTNFGAGQLARHLGLPWRSASGTAANISDVQAANETQSGLWGAILGGANQIYHAAGWLEGGLTFSMEKFITDIEVLQTVAETFLPVPADEADIGFDAISEVEPGGHFFSTAQTMERYQNAFYEPLVADWSNFGLWTENGAKTATERANGIWKNILADFQPPEKDTANMEAMVDFAERRKREGGAHPVG